MNKSIWGDVEKHFNFPGINGDIECDTLVIGGGAAGVLTAHYLNEAGIDVVLVEAKSIGGGVTKNTTGVVTAQHDILYGTLIKKHGIENAKKFLNANLWAVEEFARLNEKYDFDFERAPSVMFSENIHFNNEIASLHKLGYEKAELREKIELPYSGIKSAVMFPDMGQLHAIKMVYNIVKTLPHVYENTMIEKMESGHAVTSDGHKIKAKRIIVTTHFPFIDMHGFYFVKLFQEKSFIVAYKNVPHIDCTYVDSAEDGLYFRAYGEYMLVGGGTRRTGKACCSGYENISAFMEANYPQAEEVCRWSAQDCKSLDGIPYIGEYSKRMKNVYVASGFNEWGMTSSLISAKILSDMLTGKKNAFAPAFSPRRTCLRRQLFKNLIITLFNFLRPSFKRCSHLGCVLTFNKYERIWECACHGSTFSERGHLINNPAIHDI